MAKMGRPKIEVDFDKVERMCAIQCTGEEIASVLNISYDTLERNIKDKYNMTFAEYFRQKAGAGKASLRRMQWKQAEAGNGTMLVWLGKQYLGQRDNVEVTGHDGGPIKHEISDEDIKRAYDTLYRE